jgi:hypothetical protein
MWSAGLCLGRSGRPHSDDHIAKLRTHLLVSRAQDDYMDSVARLFATITVAYRINPKISFEVFVHKVDGLSEDQKIGGGLKCLFRWH